MAFSLGTSMCGTAHLHAKYCMHPCCSRAHQQAAGADGAGPPATPPAAGGQQGRQQQQPRQQQQGQQAAARRLGLIIDGLNNVQISVCAYPGCGRMPKDGKRTMWCAEHEVPYASGCRAAVVQQEEEGEDGAPLVLPCCKATRSQRSQFCAEHAQEERECNGTGGGAPGAAWGHGLVAVEVAQLSVDAWLLACTAGCNA